MIIRVEPGETIHTSRSADCFLRIGDGFRKLSLAEQQELTYERGTKTFEATPIDSGISDLSTTLMKSYQEIIGSSNCRDMLYAKDLVDQRHA